MKFNTLIFLLFTILLSSCKSLVPYKENSACDGTVDLGKCIKIADAYNEAVNEYENSNNPIITKTTTNTIRTNKTSSNDYYDARYKELTSLISQKETPLLKPASIFKILITPYPSQDKTIFYDSRSIYYIDKNNQWSLDVLVNNKQNNQGLKVYK